MKSDKLLLGVREAGEVIGIGRSTMYELLRSGEIESVRIGRCRRVPYSALVAYVERPSRTTPPASPNGSSGSSVTATSQPRGPTNALTASQFPQRPAA